MAQPRTGVEVMRLEDAPRKHYHCVVLLVGETRQFRSGALVQLVLLDCRATKAGASPQLTSTNLSVFPDERLCKAVQMTDKLVGISALRAAFPRLQVNSGRERSRRPSPPSLQV